MSGQSESSTFFDRLAIPMLFSLLLLIGLLIAGRVMDELSWSHIAISIFIALGIFAAFAVFNWEPRLYTAVIAVWDIGLILVIFKGDVRIR